jgi:hypothetical protein
VTGPRIDLAITLIDRLKGQFQENKLLQFDTKSTVVYLNNVRIAAFPNHHIYFSDQERFLVAEQKTRQEGERRTITNGYKSLRIWIGNSINYAMKLRSPMIEYMVVAVQALLVMIVIVIVIALVMIIAIVVM